MRRSESVRFLTIVPMPSRGVAGAHDFDDTTAKGHMRQVAR